MAITGPTSYLVTIPLFINHWKDVDDLGTVVTLDHEQTGQEEDVDRQRLVNLQGDLEEARDRVETVLLDLTLSSATLLQHKTWLQETCVQFNQIMRADHGATIFARSLPLAPGMNDAREKFLKPLRLMASLWAKVNAYRLGLETPKPALSTQNGATLATLEARLLTVRQVYDTTEEREQQATLEREQRNDLQNEIYPILKVYRLKIEAMFPADGAIMATLPTLSDDGTASPTAGSLTGTYQATTQEAVLTGTPSSSASVVRHQLRVSLGPEPSVEDETVAGEFEMGMPITLTTDYGLQTPGAMVHYRLVAITADGHEAGTDWVTIQRPL